MESKRGVQGGSQKWRAREVRSVGIRGEKNRNDEEMSGSIR
jgi:hypothetical protein